MGYTVEMEGVDLQCRSHEDAERAAEIIHADPWIHPYYLQVEPTTWEGKPYLEVLHFQGDHWSEGDARKVWLAIAPHMADGATLEFQGEGFDRWRIRWHSGRCYEDTVVSTVWSEGIEITAETLEQEAS
jgi:hypothetical protein